jgi:hypothetical protein
MRYHDGGSGLGALAVAAALQLWLEQIRDAVNTFDLIVFVPIEHADRNA